VGKTDLFLISSSLVGSLMTTWTPRPILPFCKFMSKRAILAFTIFLGISERGERGQRWVERNKEEKKALALSGHGAVEGVSLDKEAVPATLSVGLEHVDIGHGVLKWETRES